MAPAVVWVVAHHLVLVHGLGHHHHLPKVVTVKALSELFARKKSDRHETKPSNRKKTQSWRRKIVINPDLDPAVDQDNKARFKNLCFFFKLPPRNIFLYLINAFLFSGIPGCSRSDGSSQSGQYVINLKWHRLETILFPNESIRSAGHEMGRFSWSKILIKFEKSRQRMQAPHPFVHCFRIYNKNQRMVRGNKWCALTIVDCFFFRFSRQFTLGNFPMIRPIAFFSAF